MEPFKSQDGDKSTIREAEDYADSLVRELIDETAMVQSESSAEPRVDESVQQEQQQQQSQLHLSEQIDGIEQVKTTDDKDEHLLEGDNDSGQDRSLDEGGEENNKKIATTGVTFTKEEEEDEKEKEEIDVRRRESREVGEQIDEDEDKENRISLDTQFDKQPKSPLEQHYTNFDEDSLTGVTDISLIKLNDQTNLFHQTFRTAANSSQLSNDDKTETMEFTKNYSDDLLMGHQRSGSGAGADAATGSAGNTNNNGPDLADFELATHSGGSSISGSEKTPPIMQQSSTSKQKKSISSSAGPGSQRAASSSSQSAGISPTELTAVKNAIMSTYSRVSHLFHWERPIETGVLFATGMTIIVALTFFSIISVVAYSALGVIIASALIRVFKTSMKALNMSPETPFDHIWEKVQNSNLSLSLEKMHDFVDASHGNLDASLVYFKQVLLVEDKLATLKFGFFLYLLTYIGAWFNGLTLITICYTSLFVVPLLYEKNKTKIDMYLDLATKQISSTLTTAINKVSALATGANKVNVTKKQN